MVNDSLNNESSPQHCGMCNNGEENVNCTAPHHQTFKGGWLAINSMLTFILPLIMAIAGSIAAGQSYMAKFAGAISGLLCGIVTAVILSKLILRTIQEKD